MLVLTRNETETIRIGDDITITVARIYGNRVKIGIVAPAGTPVHRGEVYARIKAGVPKKKPCQRCGQRPADGSGIMCVECWIETGEPGGAE